MLVIISLLCFSRLATTSRVHVNGEQQQTSSYNESDAKQFVRYSHISFCHEDAIKEWNCGQQCDLTRRPQTIITFSNSEYGMKGYVAKDTTESGVNCLAAFRGSASLKHAKLDGRFGQSKWPDWQNLNITCSGCKVHTGFAKAYKSIRQELWAATTQCDTVSFTGHSLGASLASLAAFEARARGDMKVDHVFTFGKPRIGNKAYVTAFVELAGSSTPMWRVAKRRDVVARLPPRQFGYVHEPIEVYYSKDDFSEYRLCPPQPSGDFEDGSCSSSFSDSAAWMLAASSGHNHYFGLNFEFDKLEAACLRPNATDAGVAQDNLEVHGPEKDGDEDDADEDDEDDGPEEDEDVQKEDIEGDDTSTTSAAAASSSSETTTTTTTSTITTITTGPTTSTVTAESAVDSGVKPRRWGAAVMGFVVIGVGVVIFVVMVRRLS